MLNKNKLTGRFFFICAAILQLAAQPLSAASHAELHTAAQELTQCQRELALKGTTIPNLLNIDNAVDPDYTLSFFFHSHRGNELGHVHTFHHLPSPHLDKKPLRTYYEDGFVALVALSFDKNGQLKELFTTNLPVTGGCWYSAEDTMKGVRAFRPRQTEAGPLVDRWLGAVFTLFEDEIAQALHERDAELTKLDRRGRRNPLIDEDIEVLSRVKVSIPQKLASLA